MTKPKLCPPHDRGVRPEYPPFFYDWCPTCQAKKDAGKVTGEEGPLTVNWGDRRPGPWRRSGGGVRSKGTHAGVPRTETGSPGTSRTR